MKTNSLHIPNKLTAKKNHCMKLLLFYKAREMGDTGLEPVASCV